MDREAWWASQLGLWRVGHDWSDLACTCAPPHCESNRYQEPGPAGSGQMLDPKESVSKVENINILFLESNSSLWVGQPQRNVSFCFHLLSVQFSRSVVSDSLRPHEPQHARPPCPSPPPGVHSDSRPSSQWCHRHSEFYIVATWFSKCGLRNPEGARDFQGSARSKLFL